MIEQTIIALCGMASVWLSQDSRDGWRKWACLIGLAAQPFWLFATWKAGQWGIFALSFVYAAGWCRGVWNFWLRPMLENRKQRRAEAEALRNAEHARAIQNEHGRHYGNVCQQIADEINELQTGKVTAFTRRRMAKGRA